MNARTVNKVWTGIFYTIALVVALLVFLVFEILQKGWGFGIQFLVWRTKQYKSWWWDWCSYSIPSICLL